MCTIFFFFFFKSEQNFLFLTFFANFLLLTTLSASPTEAVFYADVANNVLDGKKDDDGGDGDVLLPMTTGATNNSATVVDPHAPLPSLENKTRNDESDEKNVFESDKETAATTSVNNNSGGGGDDNNNNSNNSGGGGGGSEKNKDTTEGGKEGEKDSKEKKSKEAISNTTILTDNNINSSLSQFTGLPNVSSPLSAENNKERKLSTNSQSEILNLSTSSIEEIPDNMYSRTETCGLIAVNNCVQAFCDCIFRLSSNNGNKTWNIKNGTYRCNSLTNTNCYYHLYCARKRVECLWNVSSSGRSYYPWIKAKERFLNHMNNDNVTGNGFCQGLLDIYFNFSKLDHVKNYYDSLFYKECVDYSFRLIKENDGAGCVASFVPTYVCGRSLMDVQPPRIINYTSLKKGSRRLVISIVARIVGNFSEIFLPKNSEEKEREKKRREEERRGRRKKQKQQQQQQEEEEINNNKNDWDNKNNNNKNDDDDDDDDDDDPLTRAMHTCFINAIGIEGEFGMQYEDECLVVDYKVGVSEADPWVGDLVTANALDLMVRNTSWLSFAQDEIYRMGSNVKLTVPIVVYKVGFEPGLENSGITICDTSCSVCIALTTFLTLSTFVFFFVFCFKWRRKVYPVLENVNESDEEMEHIVRRRLKRQ